jgi:hypothetical protein
MVERDSSSLTTSVITSTDRINTTMNAMLIQQVECNPVYHFMCTTLDTVQVTSPTSKIPQFLYLISGITTSHLDAPFVILLAFKSSMSITTTAKDKTLQMFYPDPLSLAETPLF